MRSSERPTSHPALFADARGYARLDSLVTTTVFHWYTATEGSFAGYWQPLEGRTNWTGEPDWWATQIKQIMMANIDVILVHLVTGFEPQRRNLFAALHALRSQGYDVPRVAPFLDPVGSWKPGAIDVATDAGKMEFVGHFIRFFEQYFAANPDGAAASYLARIDERIVLSTWFVYTMLLNQDRLTREDVASRLRAAFARTHPAFANGFYLISTSLIDPDLAFADERAVFFSGFCYYMQSVYHGLRTIHVQGGYTDRNIRRPGYVLPRNGGDTYRQAWDHAVQQGEDSPVHRVYVESWNEYIEGSGIFAANPHETQTLPGVAPGPPDRWSSSDDPFEYIRTTARGAARLGKRPSHDAKILWHDVPARMAAGECRTARIVVRNEGSASWTPEEGCTLAQTDAVGRPAEYEIEPRANEVAEYDGVFRGRPVVFDVEIRAPLRRGTHVVRWVMQQRGWEFGQNLEVGIEVR